MTPSRATLIVFALPLAVTVVVSCGSSSTTGSPGTTGPAPGQVAIVDYDFTPNTITIDAGQTVTWANDDDADHWVVSAPTSPATFDLGREQPGADVNYTFATPGSYPYFCNLHNYMKGLVVVR